MIETEKRRLLRVRKRINRVRPDFYAYESWRFVKIAKKWKRPRGIDNKMRTNEKSWPKVANIGWGGPAAVRGLHSSGKEEVMVYNVADLTSVTPETQVARIGGTVGGKKRAAIIEEAGKQNIRILNAGITKKKSDFEKLEDDKK